MWDDRRLGVSGAVMGLIAAVAVVLLGGSVRFVGRSMIECSYLGFCGAVAGFQTWLFVRRCAMSQGNPRTMICRSCWLTFGAFSFVLLLIDRVAFTACVFCLAPLYIIASRFPGYSELIPKDPIAIGR